MTVRAGVREAIRLLQPRDRRLLWLSMALQVATALLDLLGVLLLGLVAALSVTVLQAQPPPPVVQRAADLFGLQGLDSTQLVLVLASLAAATLLVKSVVSSYITRRVLVFLANRQALLAARLTAELLSKPISFIQKRTSQQTAYALIQGTGAATTSVLGGLTVAVTEVSLFVILGAALLFVDPIVALASFAYFALLALALQKVLGGWAARIGGSSAQAEIESLNVIQEALAVYREVTVLNRRETYVREFQGLRWHAASLSADQVLIGILPKYLFEAALVIGGLLLAALLFATEDAVSAVGTLALFLAAASRVMPSLLRLQGAALTMRAGAASASSTFELADDLGKTPYAPASDLIRELRTRFDEGHPGFDGTVSVDNVSFRYTDAPKPALEHVSVTIDAGKSLALLGRSGAGKTTLADIVLGVLREDEGRVSVSGIPPAKAIAKWPGAIAYVPQNVAMATATIRENVALGLPREAIDDEAVWEALDRAHLADTLRSSGRGLDTVVGEHGVRFSGGQRQRLGIARAMYSRPGLLVLDEATSALDAETEEAISQSLVQMSGSVTRIIVAHRLSTVRNADKVVYLEDGRVVATGTFEEVRAAVPSLERQAKLMGISGT